MGKDKKKQWGNPKVQVRIENEELLQYLSTLSGKARADTIRQMLEDSFNRQPDQLEAKAKALYAEAAKLKAEADRIFLELDALIKFRRDFTASKAVKEQAAWDDLVQRGVAGDRFAGWWGGPAAKEWLDRHGLTEEQGIALHRKGG